MKTAISFSFLFLAAYAITALFGWIPGALFFFSTSPLIVLWVVYKVLKDPIEVRETFEEQFYQDHPYRRNRSEN